MAVRPQTLPAGAAPVIVGTGLAVNQDVFATLPAMFALVGALTIQIGTNLANDYFDALKGADTQDREGFTRVTAAGLIQPSTVKQAAIFTFLIAVVIGSYLVYIGGLPILLIGLASIFAGIAYTGGPLPYGYRGLGDIFVFVFFGLIGVAGTYYVQAVASLPGIGPFPLWIPTGALPLLAIFVAIPVASLTTALLVINNIRDIETDRAAGKRTLAVMIGYRWSRIEWSILVLSAYTVPVGLWNNGYHLGILLPILTIPVAIQLGKTIWTRTDGIALNPALERMGQLLIIYSVLFALGLVMPSILT